MANNSQNNLIKTKKACLRLLKYTIDVFVYMLRKVIRIIASMQSIDEKQILFVSYPPYSDNSKVLFEYLIKSEAYRDYSFVWLIDFNNIDISIPGNNVTIIPENSKYHHGHSLKSIRYICTSKYIFIPTLPR